MGDAAQDLWGLAVGMASNSLARTTVENGAREIEKLRAALEMAQAQLKSLRSKFKLAAIALRRDEGSHGLVMQMIDDELAHR